MTTTLRRQITTDRLGRLSGVAQELAVGAIAANTRRAYQGALQRLSDALQEQPLNDTSLAEYLAARHQEGVSPATAGVLIAAVRFQARVTGQPSPVGPATRTVLAGIRREGKSRGRGQVQGLRWNQADTVAAIAAKEGHGSAGLRDAAIIALMSDALLRVSELVALKVDDLQVEPDGSGRLTVRSSKTDQEGDGAVQYVGASTVRRVRVWMDAAGFSAGPLFRRVRRGGAVGSGPITDRAVRSIIRKRAGAADLEGRFSGHSLRVGSVQSLAAGGASLVAMQQAGRWSSPYMPSHYARSQLVARGAVARIRYGV